jgi:putative colanic acid biosynthesis acetyltransferase WcaF
MKVNNSLYDNSAHSVGRSKLTYTLWYIIHSIFFLNALNPVSRIKVFWLRIFGANIGKGVYIKPRVSVKYPWKLSIGNHCWIGEQVWIDNLDQVSIQNNVCISQGAFLLCGNHNYKLPTFDLIVKPIVLENGCWIGAKSVVGPGVTVHEHAVLALGSVASGNLEANGIYQGNPAEFRKTRVISTI